MLLFKCYFGLLQTLHFNPSYSCLDTCNVYCKITLKVCCMSTLHSIRIVMPCLKSAFLVTKESLFAHTVMNCSRMVAKCMQGLHQHNVIFITF